MDFVPKNILIIKLRHHGDVLLTTPVARVLKEQNPDSQIDALIYQETLDMLRYNDDFRQIYTVDRQWKKLGAWKHLMKELALLGQLKKNQYDLIINLSDNWRGAFVSLLCRPEVAISHAYLKRQNALWRYCFNRLVPVPSQETHNVEFNLGLLAALGFIQKDITKNNYPLKLKATSQDVVVVKQKLIEQGWRGEPYVLIHPGARWFFKCWDDEKMLEIMQRLLEHGYSVVLSGGKDEKEIAMAQFFGQHLQQNQHFYNLIGQLSLAELAALISEAKLFIGVDSAPMHMAAALGISTIALFGPSKLEQWYPWSEHAKVIYAGDYGPLIDPYSVDTSTTERYLSNIPAEPVWAEVSAVLQQK